MLLNNYSDGHRAHFFKVINKRPADLSRSFLSYLLGRSLIKFTSEEKSVRCLRCIPFRFKRTQTPKPKYSRWKKIFTSTSELMHSRRIFTALNSRYLETSSLHIIKATLTLGKKINSIFKVNQNALSVLWFPKGEERQVTQCLSIHFDLGLFCFPDNNFFILFRAHAMTIKVNKSFSLKFWTRLTLSAQPFEILIDGTRFKPKIVTHNIQRNVFVTLRLIRLWYI